MTLYEVQGPPLVGGVMTRLADVGLTGVALAMTGWVMAGVATVAGAEGMVAVPLALMPTACTAGGRHTHKFANEVDSVHAMNRYCTPQVGSLRQLATHSSSVGGARLQALDGAVGGVGAAGGDAGPNTIGWAQCDIVGGVGASRRGRGDGGGHRGGAGRRLAGQGGLGSGWRGDGHRCRDGAWVATGVHSHDLCFTAGKYSAHEHSVFQTQVTTAEIAVQANA